MDAFAWWLMSATAAFVCAALSEPLLRRPGMIGRIGTGCTAALLYCAPLLVPPDFVRARAMTALVSIVLTFKLLDFRWHCVSNPEPPVSRATFLRFLIPLPLVLIFGPHARRCEEPRQTSVDITRLFAGVAVFAAVFAGLVQLQAVPLLRESFLLDHCVKVGLFIVLVESLSVWLMALERLCGFDTRPVANRVIASRSVTEFWLRYNTRVHDWLYKNIFQRAGGRRAPVRAVLLTFFVSGAFHEWMFGITTSRFDGYQFAFFMLQAPACLLSPKLQRLARRPSIIARAFAHGVTIAWFTVTSMLFFHGVNRVFAFTYAAEPWLP